MKNNQKIRNLDNIKKVGLNLVIKIWQKWQLYRVMVKKYVKKIKYYIFLFNKSKKYFLSNIIVNKKKGFNSDELWSIKYLSKF